MPKQYKKPVRIKDIALKAGVSAGTVDRVLHSRGKVSPENEKRVREAISVLEYKPNMMARSLAMNAAFQIAILLPSYVDDSFWKAQLTGIEEAFKYIKDFGFSIKILQFNDQKHGDMLKHKETLINLKIDALLLAPTITDDAHELLDVCQVCSIPYLLINTNLERIDTNCLGYVGQDSYQSGKLGTKLLTMMTNKSGAVGLIHMEKEVDNSVHLIQKERGFREFLLEKNYSKVSSFQERILFSSNKEDLKNAVKKLLENHPNTKGLFVTTSRVHYLVDALISLNRSDIALVGFDLIKENVLAIEKYEELLLINQNPKLQAYTGLISIFEYLLSKKVVDRKKYLPLDVVTKENISPYIERQ